MYLIKLQGGSLAYLQGPDATGVVRGATYAPGSSEEAELVDTIDVYLEGTAEGIEAALEQIEICLRQGEALGRGGLPGAMPGAMPVYLYCMVTEGGTMWRSPVRGGWIEYGPAGVDGRAVGAQAARVRVRRANYWERAARQVTYLENPNGSSGLVDPAEPVTVTNHADQGLGHVNYVFEGGLGHDQGVLEPVPVRLEMALTDAQNPYPVTALVGHWVYGGNAPVGLVIQGESGAARGQAAGTVVSDAASAGGQYLRLDWPGSAEGELWVGEISGNAASLSGQPFRVLLRLAGGGLPAGEQVWYRWRVYLADGGGAEHLLYESPGRVMETASECALGLALRLPPWAVDTPQADEGESPTLRLALVAQAAGDGPHTLRLDFLQLLPLDGWRIYRPLDDQRTLEIIDDGLEGTLSNDYGWQSHAAEGPGLDLRPGTGSTIVFVLLRHEPAGITWPVDLGLAVRMYHRGRRRGV